MNGTFEIKSQTSNSQYEYVNTDIIVQGSFQKNITTNELIGMNGSCYRKGQSGELGDYIGNFNGYVRNNEIVYSISEMSRRDSNKVWDAIDEIEPYITGEDNEQE